MHVVGSSAKSERGKVVVTPNDEGSIVLQAKFISLEREEFLVTAQTDGVHIWNDAGTEHLSFVPAQECTKGSETTPDFFLRGIDSIAGSPYFFVGTCEGNMARIYFDGNKNADVEQVICSDNDCVVAVSCSSDSVLSAHDDGAAVLWDSERTSPDFQFNGPASCTAASLRANFVVVGYANGTVRVWRKTTRTLEHEIFAHARCVTALDMHPTLNMFATVGQDTCVHVWKIPDGAAAGKKNISEQQQDDEEDDGTKKKNVIQMSVVHTDNVEDALLTGVQFARDGSTDLAVSAYDLNQLVVWRG